MPARPSPSPTAGPIVTAEPTPTLLPAPATSLGLTRADAARLFQFLEFDFQLAQASEHPEDYVGTVSDGLATVHLIGPDTGISSVSLVIDVPTPPTENQSARTTAYLAAVLSVAAADWAEGTSWLNEQLNVIGESRFTFDSRLAILLLEPRSDAMHVEFTIAAAP